MRRFALASNFVAALHNVPFVVLVMFLCPPPISSEIFLAIPGLFLLGIAALGIAIGLSVCCAYMPDLAEFISSMLRFVFFFTPLWWMPNMRPSVEPFVLANPFYHVVNVVRGRSCTVIML
ncbi:MAG: ABC transporter permease [Terricaulis sp.]